MSDTIKAMFGLLFIFALAFLCSHITAPILEAMK